MTDEIENYRKYLEILELDPDKDPTPDKIQDAYRMLKESYSADSMAIDALDDEFSLEDRQGFLERVEEAYKVLSDHFCEVGKKEEIIVEEVKVEEAQVEDVIVEEINIEYIHPEEAKLEEEEPVKKSIIEDTLPEWFPGEEEEKEQLQEEKVPEAEHIIEPEIEPEIAPTDESELNFEYTKPEIEEEDEKEEVALIRISDDITIKGRTLRKIREKLGLGIHEIAVLTKISYKILVEIEKDRFDLLPEAGYLRWCVMTYAKALSLDSQKVTEEYMKRYREWKREHEGKTDVEIS